jgi:hypothetical protein
MLHELVRNYCQNHWNLVFVRYSKNYTTTFGKLDLLESSFGEENTSLVPRPTLDNPYLISYTYINTRNKVKSKGDKKEIYNKNCY